MSDLKQFMSFPINYSLKLNASAPARAPYFDGAKDINAIDIAFAESMLKGANESVSHKFYQDHEYLIFAHGWEVSRSYYEEEEQDGSLTTKTKYDPVSDYQILFKHFDVVIKKTTMLIWTRANNPQGEYVVLSISPGDSKLMENRMRRIYDAWDQFVEEVQNPALLEMNLMKELTVNFNEPETEPENPTDWAQYDQVGEFA